MAQARAEAWPVPEAPVRFRLRLANRPTHASAGYFAQLPDGGILPGPYPATQVVTENGASLDSYLLWHNRDSGLGLVFTDPGPGADMVYVYVAGSKRLRLWRPETGLTPSAILCADPTTGTLGAARELAQLGRVGPTVHYRNKAGIRRAPLSIGGDDSGRPRPCSFYLLAHLVTTDPGKTWIAPFVLDGDSEVRVDGELLKPRKRIDKWGGTGQWFDLAEGIHRLEVMQTAGGSGGFDTRQTGGLMYLTWRTPSATPRELGGVRSDKVPMSGTSRQETRVLRDSEIARSGRCTFEYAEAQDGGPVACVQLKATHNFWFGEEDPLVAYELRAITGGDPDDTVYTWGLPDAGKASGKALTWLFPGFRENRLTLTAVSGGRRSQCVYPFYGFTTAHTDLNHPLDRRAFRAACYNMVEAYPAQPDPTAGWGPSYWNNLFRTLDFGKGYPLLRNLFSVRGRTLQGKLTQDQLMVLQDIFLDTAARMDSDEALRWIKTFHDAAPAPDRRGRLKIREAEIHLYYRDDADAAERVLRGLARGIGETAEGAKIRLGDLALLRGDLNLATSFYADVQNRVRRDRNAGATPLDELVGEDLIVTPDGARAKLEPAAAQAGSAPALQGPAANWKRGVLLDVSIAENVGHLIARGYLLEAQRALAAWERTSPLSKITGDYIINESRLYMEIEDWQRARPMLEAYCNIVDASSFLPDAARALVKCMEAMNVPDDEMKAYAEKLRERLEFHPVAKELDLILEKE